MRPVAKLGLALCAAGLLASCGRGGGAGNAAAAADTRQRPASVVIVNHLRGDIGHVFFSDPGSSVRQELWHGAELLAGESRTYAVPPGQGCLMDLDIETTITHEQRRFPRADLCVPQFVVGP